MEISLPPKEIKTSRLTTILARWRGLQIALVLFFVINYFLIWPSWWDRVLVWRLPDSDDVTRVLEVRAWLNGQGFYDLFLHRSNPPLGGELHWSRLADIPLALVQLILRPFVSHEMAEKIAVFITPQLLGIIFAFVAGYCARRLSGSRSAFYIAAALTMITGAVHLDYTPGRVDHHGLQLLMLGLILHGFLIDGKKGGIIAGFALAASLTIGFELLPFEITAVVWLALMWVFSGHVKNETFKGFGLGLMIGITIGFLINIPPSKFFESANDKLSIATFLPIFVGAMGFFLLAQFQNSASIFKRFLFLGILGVIVILIALQFRVLLKPLYWQISPLLQQLWLNDTGETMPLWSFPLRFKTTLGSILVIALGICIYRLYRLRKFIGTAHGFKAFFDWLLLGLLVFVGTILTFFYQVRILNPASGIAIIAIAALLGRIFDFYNIIFGLIATLAFTPINADSLTRLAVKFIPEAPAKYSYGARVGCRASTDFAALAALPKGLVLNNINLGAEAIMNTPHDVITTHFHRDTGKYKAYQIFLAKPEKARELLEKYNINYIGYCGRGLEVKRMVEFDKKDFMAAMQSKTPPKWLTPIAPAKGSDIKVFVFKYPEN